MRVWGRSGMEFEKFCVAEKNDASKAEEYEWKGGA